MHQAQQQAQLQAQLQMPQRSASVAKPAWWWAVDALELELVASQPERDRRRCLSSHRPSATPTAVGDARLLAPEAAW